VTIAHEEIPGYMDPMTMPFTLRDEWAFSELEPGSQIQATLVVDTGLSWLENPVITSPASPDSTGGNAAGGEPEPGLEVPDLGLVNQDSRAIRLGGYRGRNLVLTFIYTRCPLPDYCPLMTSNFKKIDQELRKNPALQARTRLLSVSVDPEYDRPKVLKEYGQKVAGLAPADFKRWEFATGSPEQVKAVAQFFGMSYWTEKDQVIHSLRTAVIGPDGKLIKLYRGNEWKPEEIVRDLEAAAAK
jgi:protein SCO1/2